MDWERRRLLQGEVFFTSISATVGVRGLEKAGPQQADNWRHFLGNGVVKTCEIRNLLVYLVQRRMQNCFASL